MDQKIIDHAINLLFRDIRLLKEDVKLLKIVNGYGMADSRFSTVLPFTMAEDPNEYGITYLKDINQFMVCSFIRKKDDIYYTTISRTHLIRGEIDKGLAKILIEEGGKILKRIDIWELIQSNNSKQNRRAFI